MWRDLNLGVLDAAGVEAIFQELAVVALKAAAKLDPWALVSLTTSADWALVDWAMAVASDCPPSRSPSSDRHPAPTEVAGTAAESPDSHWRCGTSSQQTTRALEREGKNPTLRQTAAGSGTARPKASPVSSEAPACLSAPQATTPQQSTRHNCPHRSSD